MAYLLSPLYNDAQFDSAGDPLVGGKLYWYQAGTTTPATVYTDATGATSHANPIILNARGEAASPIYLDDSLSYKAVLTDADDAVIRTIDGIDGIGTSGGGAVSEWTVFGGAPTYVDADEFSVAGDQRSAFHVGRRVRLTLSGSTLYGTIAASSYASATTVQVTLDSGALDGTLSAVAYGLAYANTAVPMIDATVKSLVFAYRSSSQTSGTTIICGSEDIDAAGAYDSTTGVFTAPAAGKYLVTIDATFANAAATAYNATLDIRNASTLKGAAHYAGVEPGGSTQLSVTAIVDCAASDQLSVRSSTSFSASTIYLARANLTIMRVA